MATKFKVGDKVQMDKRYVMDGPYLVGRVEEVKAKSVKIRWDINGAADHGFYMKDVIVKA